MNPDTDRRIRLELLGVDREIYESGKKTLRIQKYPDTCEQGLWINKCVCRMKERGILVRAAAHVITLIYLSHKESSKEFQVLQDKCMLSESIFKNND